MAVVIKGEESIGPRNRVEIGLKFKKMAEKKGDFQGFN